ncbi:protein kinase [Streptomyces phaeoluteigriseus]|uniref:non-specific serine/threonine protein kinase n=1 Tax=Streptomyces phaeoluteigriseus TaxID=114686 RepID=A0ABY4Z9S3_9ACTN|nr:serine/threonine-protein kinase [Streptomyces phaeoluteigriseus]USQ85564.1 protein kinase [Streptomyces phaeoluteigriseus]
MAEGNDAERLVAGRYRLLRRLGAGGMGRVWLAHDQVLDCEVALKEIALPTGVPEDQVGARIARARVEARHAARLRSHPHVATVYDVLEEDGLPWIVMGFVPGAKDLAEVVRDHGPLSPADTARIGVAVLDALTAGHQTGILHRDVKPANILLTKAAAQGLGGAAVGQVLLTDYGISLEPDSGETRLTATSGFMGTPGFLAPERARGVAPSPASDLFSLGATLYYAVEGRGPFDRPTPYETLTALLFEEPPPMTRAGDLGPVLDALMAKDPEQRLGGDEAMRALAGLTATPGAEPVAHRPTILEMETAPLPDEPPASRPPPGAPPAEERRSPAVAPSRQRHGWSAKAPAGRVWGVIAAVLVLTGGGIWVGVTLLDRPGTKAPKSDLVPLYGDQVGLTRELKPGNCVSASWPAERFNDPPTLKIVDCRTYPDGQVLDVNATTSLDDARTNGQGVCRGLLRDTTSRMADVQSYALVPSESGWDNGLRNTACLLFGKTVGLYGPVGDYRKHGEQIFVENSSIGDCYNLRKLEENNYAHVLVDCGQPHELQGLGYVKAPGSVQFDAWDSMYDLCVKRWGSYKSSTRDLYAWNHAENTWNQGFRFVMCLLAMPEEGQKLPPGSATAAPSPARFDLAGVPVAAARNRP